MADIRIPYGRGFQTAHVPDERLRAVLMPAHSGRAEGSESEIVRAALQSPIASERLCRLARNKRHILVIISDHTRPVPSRLTLPILLEEIRRENPMANVTILVATGMHRPTTEAELRDKVGDEIVENEHIVVHRSEQDEEMAFFGILPSRGELWLNRLVRDADLVVSEGFIEPHFFAGFSGGRKAILPGVASRRTVLYNHNAGFIAAPDSRQGVLRGNLIHQDMAFAAERAGLQFILNVLLDAEKHVIAAVAGHARQAHEAGCALCRHMTSVQAVPADIVITSNGGYPLDQNIYQSVKGMTAAEACVRPGGAIILCAAIGDGIGGDAFYHWFADRKNAREVARAIEDIPADQTLPDQWQAQILARVMQKATCYFVAGEENRKVIEDMHMRWAPSADAALRMASEELGDQSSVVVIPDGVGVIVE